MTWVARKTATNVDEEEQRDAAACAQRRLRMELHGICMVAAITGSCAIAPWAWAWVTSCVDVTRASCQSEKLACHQQTTMMPTWRAVDHLHPQGLQLCAHGVCDAHQRGLAGAVGGPEGLRGVAGNAANVHDGACRPKGQRRTDVFERQLQDKE